MKIIFIVLFFIALTSPLHRLAAQNQFAILEKNVNVRAKDLTQSLNTTKDTLLLQSNSVINRVYAVNMNYKREIDLAVREKTVKIPLKKLSKGKHVFVAVQSSFRIVFVVKILGEDAVLLALKDDELLSQN